MKVLLVSPSVAPYADGEQADYVRHLAVALGKRGAETTVVTALSPGLDTQKFGVARRLVSVKVDGDDLGIYEAELDGGAAKVFFVDDEKGLLSNLDSLPNEYRRTIRFAHAVAGLTGEFGWQPDVVHTHGWETALLCLFMRTRNDHPLARASTVFTVHTPWDLALIDASEVDHIPGARELFHPDGMEYFGQASLLKAALVTADRITVPSESAVDGLRTEVGGYGLDGLYRFLDRRFVGIGHGVDTTTFDPETNTKLPARFGIDDYRGKRTCKNALLEQLGLPIGPGPLMLFWGPCHDRETAERLIQACATREDGGAIAIFDAGEHAEQLRAGLVANKNIRVFSELPSSLSACLAAADALFVVDKRCAFASDLTLKAMRYGTVPMVFGSGAAADRVIPFDEQSRTGTGFRYTTDTVDEITQALGTIDNLYRRTAAWTMLLANCLRQKAEWSTVAERHIHLYQSSRA